MGRAHGLIDLFEQITLRATEANLLLLLRFLVLPCFRGLRDLLSLWEAELDTLQIIARVRLEKQLYFIA